MSITVTEAITLAAYAVKFFYPNAAPIMDQIQRAAPLIEAAVKEGKSAYLAARDAAPELAAEIKRYTSGKFGPGDFVAREIVAKKLFTPHLMTFEEEQHWMDSMGKPEG